MMQHPLSCRVYYEDTDAGGIVYHANYLKFAERGRTEWLRGQGWDHRQLLAELGCLIVVKSLAIEFHAPARLDDLLTVTTEITGGTAATLDMKQIIRHEDGERATILVKLVAITPDGKVVRFPHLGNRDEG
jgi:acyl-CoA thioester hydrolase